MTKLRLSAVTKVNASTRTTLLRNFIKSALLTLTFATLAFAADEPKLARVYVTFEGASRPTITPSKPAEIDLRFRVKQGFHINSNKPNSELLIPTTLKLAPPSDLAAGSIAYPTGKELTFPFDPSEKLSVYSDEFVVKAMMSAAHNASSGNFTVHGQLHYQACSDNACFPPRDIAVQFDVRVVNNLARAHHGTGQSPHIK
jgi:hypothetical protein